MNPKLADIWAGRSIELDPSYIWNNQRLVLSDNFRNRLLELGGKAIEPHPYSESQCYFLPIGIIDEYHYWIEFFESTNLGIPWRLRVRAVESPPEDRSNNDWAQIANRIGGIRKPCEILKSRIEMCELSADSTTALDDTICECLGRYYEGLAIHNLGIKARARIESILTTRGYFAIWPPRVVFDLERLTVLGSGHKYYIDSIDRSIDTNAGVSFEDLTGARILLSHSTQFVVEPLTFASVEELRQESESLVVPCVELLHGFSFARAIPLDRIVTIYGADAGSEDPLVLENSIAYNFYVPIPAIADTLKPIIETSGLSI